MSTNSYWWITLALGLVVLLVATLLLHFFLKQVHRIEAGAEQIWATGKQVARNTATTTPMQGALRGWLCLRGGGRRPR